MLLRTLLSLALFIQHAMLPVVLTGGPRDGGCDMDACCGTVETTSCCGETVVAKVCRRSGGACRCGVTPGETNRPAPAPAPRDGRDLIPVFVNDLAPIGLVLVLPANRPLHRGADAPVHRTHHEIQALLCVWRT